MLLDGSKAESIVEYTANETASFADKPLTSVDALVLAELAYFKWGRLPGVPSGFGPGEAPELRDVCGAGDFYTVMDEGRSRSQKMTLLAALYSSTRWSGLRIADHADVFDKDAAKQFSATTFILPDGTVFVAFRGTDSTLAGWKEDFMLAFSEVIPSQDAARAYLEQAVARYEGPVVVGGHSKGGNLAVYAAAACDAATAARVTGVFDFDGPGFSAATLARIDVKAVVPRLMRVVPVDSTVGMLLNTPGPYAVVESTAYAFDQHDPFTWVVRDGDFAYLPAVSEFSSYINTAVSSWVASMPAQRMREFTDALFGLLGAGEDSSTARQGADARARYLESLDPETRAMLSDIAGKAVAVASEHLDVLRVVDDYLERELFGEKTDPVTRFHDLGSKLDDFGSRYGL